MKGLATAVLGFVLVYLADPSHFTGVTTPVVAALIAAIAQGLHDHIQDKTGNLLFGAIRRS